MDSFEENPYEWYLSNPNHVDYIKIPRIQEEINESLTSIYHTGRGQDLLIYGHGGIGKTSCLDHAFDLAKNQYQVLPVYMDVLPWIEEGGMKSITDFYTVIMDYVEDEVSRFASFTSSVMEKFRDSIQEITLSIKLPVVEGSTTFDVSRQNANFTRQGAEVFNLLFDEIQKHINVRGVLLLIDNADNMPPSATYAIRGIFPTNGHYTIFMTSGKNVFLGSQFLRHEPDSEEQIEEMLADPARRAGREFRWIRLNRMDARQLEILLRRPIDEYNGRPNRRKYSIDGFTCELIFKLTAGVPSLAYNFAIEAADYAQSKDGRVLLSHSRILDVIEHSWAYEFLMRNYQSFPDDLNNNISDY